MATMRDLFVGFSVELVMGYSNFPLMKTAGTPWHIQHWECVVAESPPETNSTTSRTVTFNVSS